jgi:hypothetical protein
MTATFLFWCSVKLFSSSRSHAWHDTFLNEPCLLEKLANPRSLMAHTMCMLLPRPLATIVRAFCPLGAHPHERLQNRLKLAECFQEERLYLFVIQEGNCDENHRQQDRRSFEANVSCCRTYNSGENQQNSFPSSLRPIQRSLYLPIYLQLRTNFWGTESMLQLHVKEHVPNWLRCKTTQRSHAL